MKADRAAAAREKLRARIRDAGLRCTPARLAVLEELSGADVPLTHADLAARVAPQGFDRATVYRNLVELAQAELLTRIDVGDLVWRFEMRDSRQNRPNDHPHFFCTQCGQVRCLEEVEVKIKPSPGSKRSGVARVTEVLLKGRCSHCG